MEKNTAVMRPFSILKPIMGFGRFLCWGIERARSEMSLGVLSYNLCGKSPEVAGPGPLEHKNLLICEKAKVDPSWAFVCLEQNYRFFGSILVKEKSSAQGVPKFPTGCYSLRGKQ